MSSTTAPPPERSGFRLLRLEWWYDRLSEPRRLALGFATIVFFGSASLYLLGLASLVLVNRPDLASPPIATMIEPTGTPQAILVEAPQPPEPEATTQPTPSNTPTPAVQTDGALIQAPEVPELPIYWSPPVVYKPRVVTETYDPPVAPAAPVAPPQATPTRVVAPASIIGTAITAPLRTSAPIPVAPIISTPAGGVRAPTPGQAAVVTPASAGPTVSPPRTAVPQPPIAPTRAVVATPNAPTLVPAQRR